MDTWKPPIDPPTDFYVETEGGAVFGPWLTMGNAMKCAQKLARVNGIGVSIRKFSSVLTLTDEVK